MHIVRKDLLEALYKLFHLRFCVSSDQWQEFFYESNRNYNSYRFSDKFTFISFLTFGRNQKQVLCFEQVGGLIWFLFIASRTLLKR